MSEIINIKEASQEQIKALQNKNLEIAKYFFEICKENNLRIYFCGGCAIGTLRHKGFVPWDDDVDFFMPRPDYEKLENIWREKNEMTNYIYCRTNDKMNFHHAGTSIRDENTTFINRHSQDEDICHGVGIEIIPIDGCPKSKIKRAVQLYNAMIFAIFNTQRLPDNKGGLARKITAILYKIIKNPDKRIKLWKNAEKRMSKYEWNEVDEVTELIGSLKGMLLRHPKEWFDTYVLMDFEDTKFPMMKGHEEYLKLIFGDYMELPPVESRIAKHNTVYINMEEGYKQYKGKYYCVDKNIEKEG